MVAAGKAGFSTAITRSCQFARRVQRVPGRHRARERDDHRAAARTEAAGQVETFAPVPRATDAVPLDPVLAARLARLGDRVSRPTEVSPPTTGV
jgi:hypothetical protein